ncbi:hypothetical protein CHARACLAT_018994 [Characodon lateralis]|uniref:Uncharacterized protein n=1 Tax=Characodon lateralis TaxID=208331 RepID=A0ABU7DVG6_9TELE|nr:hypothetical protein [Characodon lateralis]
MALEIMGVRHLVITEGVVKQETLQHLIAGVFALSGQVLMLKLFLPVVWSQSDPRSETKIQAYCNFSGLNPSWRLPGSHTSTDLSTLSSSPSRRVLSQTKTSWNSLPRIMWFNLPGSSSLLQSTSVGTLHPSSPPGD